MKLIKGDFDNYSGLYLINGINQKQINFEEFLDDITYISNDIYIPNMKVIDFISDSNRRKRTCSEQQYKGLWISKYY
nr:hypothetical protein [Mycoplasmopsis bovis]